MKKIFLILFTSILIFKGTLLYAGEVGGSISTGIQTGIDGVIINSPLFYTISGVNNKSKTIAIKSLGAVYSCYTLNGTAPLCNWNNLACTSGFKILYSGNITLVNNGTVKAVSCYQGALQSLISSKRYMFIRDSCPLGDYTGNNFDGDCGHRPVGSGGGGGSLGPTISTYTISISPKKAFVTFDNISLKRIIYGIIPTEFKMEHTSKKYSVLIKKNTQITIKGGDNDGKIFIGELEAPKKLRNTSMPKVDGKNIAFRALEIGSSKEDLIFSKPVTIELSTSGLSKSLIRSNLFPYSWNEKSKKYILENKNIQYFGEEEKITFETNHATKFILAYGKIYGDENLDTLHASANSSFRDIDGHWAESFIASLAEKGVFKNNTKFRPNDYLKRAELLKIIVKGFKLGESLNLNNIKFKDIDVDAWYVNFLSKAVDLNIVHGPLKKDTFKPGDGVNRAEAMKMILIGAGIKDFTEGGGNIFNDVSNQWFKKYVNFAFEKGIVKGYGDGGFRPGNNVTRAEIAKIIFSTMEIFSK